VKDKGSKEEKEDTVSLPTMIKGYKPTVWKEEKKLDGGRNVLSSSAYG